MCSSRQTKNLVSKRTNIYTLSDATHHLQSSWPRVIPVLPKTADWGKFLIKMPQSKFTYLSMATNRIFVCELFVLQSFQKPTLPSQRRQEAGRADLSQGSNLNQVSLKFRVPLWAGFLKICFNFLHEKNARLRWHFLLKGFKSGVNFHFLEKSHF